jgi:hypothetical protein
MPIDPNIALQVKPLQLNDPLAQYAQASQIQNYQNQNALAQYQLGAAQRTEKAQNVLSEAYKQGLNPNGTIDYAKVRNAMVGGGIGHQIPALNKEIAAEAQSTATTAKNVSQTKEIDYKLKEEKANKAVSDIAALSSPQDAIASIDKHLANGDIDQQKADSLKATLMPFTTPGPNGESPPRFVNWQQKMITGILGAKDKLALETPKIREIVAADGSKTYVDENPNSPTFKQSMLAPQPAGMTPYQKGTLAQNAIRNQISAAHLNVAQNTPTVTQVVDPTNPNQMLTVDARRYKAGTGFGAPGVIGVGGKEPSAALRENKVEVGRTQLKDDLDNLRESFKKLDTMTAIPSTERNALVNLSAGVSASAAGQKMGQMFGTPEQVERDVINSARMRLINSIKNATGMSAQQLNSNVELQTMLKSISDPGQSYQSAIRIIDDIENAYVNGKGMKKLPGGKEASSAAPSAAPVVPNIDKLLEKYK